MLVDLATLALRVRCVRPATIRPFVPIETKPTQVSEHTLGSSWTYARLIEILDAQHKLAPGAAGEEPYKQGCAQVAQV
jgi:hypothetical protein